MDPERMGFSIHFIDTCVHVRTHTHTHTELYSQCQVSKFQNIYSPTPAFEELMVQRGRQVITM